MDDLQLLRDLRADAPSDPPSRAREVFLEEIHPERRSAARWLVSAAAVLILAAGGVALQAGPAAEPSSAAVVLNQAADVVARDAAPRPAAKQWYYRSGHGGWMHDYDPATSPKSEGWFTFDGTMYGEVSSDAPDDVYVGTIAPEIVAENGSSAEFYDAMAALPDDPEALLETLREGGLVDTSGDTEAERDFSAVTYAFHHEPLPAHARANLFRALATIPGVAVDEDAPPDLLGRTVLAVTFGGSELDSGVESRREVLFDPTTFDLLGDREVALEAGQVHDGVDTFDVEAGETYWESVGFAAVPVPGPGHRP